MCASKALLTSAPKNNPRRTGGCDGGRGRDTMVGSKMVVLQGGSVRRERAGPPCKTSRGYRPEPRSRSETRPEPISRPETPPEPRSPPAIPAPRVASNAVAGAVIAASEAVIAKAAIRVENVWVIGKLLRFDEMNMHRLSAIRYGGKPDPQVCVSLWKRSGNA